jgi:hypothetical protein
LKLRNIGKEDASSVNLSLSCDNDLINITNNNNIVDNISADEIVNVEDAFHLDIVSEIPNGSTITFTLNIEHDGTKHEEKFEVSVNSYNFEIININLLIFTLQNKNGIILLKYSVGSDKNEN